MPENIWKELVKYGGVSIIAVWLVYWLTTDMTTALELHSLTVGENFENIARVVEQLCAFAAPSPEEALEKCFLFSNGN